jgi:hypothetical protein
MRSDRVSGGREAPPAACSRACEGASEASQMRISADGEKSCPSRVGPSTLYAKWFKPVRIHDSEFTRARHDTCVVD